MAEGRLTREEAEAVARECLRVLREEFGVKEAFVFGSLRGEGPWHEGSDIDIAVEGLAPEEYWRALVVLGRLVPAGVGLDLVLLEGASERLRARARGEVAMPEEPQARLRAHIEDELASMERMVKAVDAFLAKARRRPSEVRLAWLAKHVHDFYTSVERVFERVAVHFGEGVPSGERWHMELLERMQKEVPGVRPQVVDEALGARLEEYLRFRHLFRYLYAEELDWGRLRPLVEGMGGTLKAFREQVEHFLKVVEEGGAWRRLG